jgi:hypothetical protein
MRARISPLSLRLIWISLISACLALLAPLESASMAVRMAFAGDICSTSASKATSPSNGEVDSQGSRKGSLPTSAHKHCPACFVHQNLAAPPPATLVVLTAPTLQQRQRWQIHALPYQAVEWAHLPSRAPPSIPA